MSAPGRRAPSFSLYSEDNRGLCEPRRWQTLSLIVKISHRNEGLEKEMGTSCCISYHLKRISSAAGISYRWMSSHNRLDVFHMGRTLNQIASYVLVWLSMDPQFFGKLQQILILDDNREPSAPGKPGLNPVTSY